MRRLWRLFAAVLLVSTPGVLHAAWHEASTRHFIIYSNDDPDELREFASRLEQFDYAVRTVRQMDNPAVAPSARLTIFVVGSADEVGKLARDRSGWIAGFYVARSSGSIAVVPRKTYSGDSSFRSETIFFHEYAHHMMYDQLTQAVPLWFSEGFAEFFSTARFQRDGAVMVGIAPAHRGYGIFDSFGVDYSKLLTGRYSSKMDLGDIDSLYGRGWLLVHYLSFTPARQGQLTDYLSRLANGENQESAAKSAFGDLTQLGIEVERYIKKRQLPVLQVRSAASQIGDIRIRPLRAGEAAIMPTRIRSKVGVTEKDAPDVLANAKKIAAQHPADALVAVALAEASLDAGDHAGAIEAARRATALDPTSVEAKLFLGKGLVGKPGANAADIKAARAQFLAANKLEPEHPEPLRAYYESFVAEGEAPTKNAIAGLHYAAVLAPADRDLRWMSAQRHLLDGELLPARKRLAVLAFDPHGGKAAEKARSVIELIDSDKEEQALKLLQGAAIEEPASSTKE